MTATVFMIDATSQDRPTALVVETSPGDAVWTATALSQLGLRVIVSDTFEQASAELRAKPSLLVTALRLAEYNGLHLVLRGKSADPDLAAVVTNKVDDPVLRDEAEKLGATFVVRKVAVSEFQAAVLRTLFAGTSGPAPIRPPFERRAARRRKADVPGHGAERRIADRRRFFPPPASAGNN